MALAVLCIGHASYDLVFAVPHHPQADEKCTATAMVSCGGGPAANAAVAVARFGLSSEFVGYLGNDLYGQAHLAELHRDDVGTALVQRGERPTPLSAVLVKPDGSRALVNYRGNASALPAAAADLSKVVPKVVLFDGHEPLLSNHWVPHFRKRRIATVLDAGSLHLGTQALMDQVDYLVCSQKFAAQFLGRDDPCTALPVLAQRAPVVVITLGEKGLIWQRGSERGQLPAYPVQAVDTTGAGDAFHGIFAACLAEARPWQELLRYASAAGALCSTQLGARPGIPTRASVERFLAID